MVSYEELQKSVTKKSLNEKLLKYGTPFVQKNEIRFAEGWEEGEEALKTTQRLVFFNIK